MILDGKKVRNELLEYYENKIKEENIKITLAIIYVGSDEPSKIYINNKIKYCEKVGIKTLLYEMDEKTKITWFCRNISFDTDCTPAYIVSDDIFSHCGSSSASWCGV